MKVGAQTNNNVFYTGGVVFSKHSDVPAALKLLIVFDESKIKILAQNYNHNNYILNYRQIVCKPWHSIRLCISISDLKSINWSSSWLCWWWRHWCVSKTFLCEWGLQWASMMWVRLTITMMQDWQWPSPWSPQCPVRSQLQLHWASSISPPHCATQWLRFSNNGFINVKCGTFNVHCSVILTQYFWVSSITPPHCTVAL